jgi:radical SAM protein with 4Fe4S-binding SPASM domain
MKKYVQILEQLAPYSKNIYVSPQFQGEPLLNPKILEMVRFAKEKGFEVGFNTNGMLLSRDVATKLVELKLDSLCISVDAITEDVFEGIRIGSNFNKIMNNIDTLLRLRDSSMTVYVNAVRMDENRDEIPALVDYWLGRVDYVSVSSVWALGDVKEKSYVPERYPCPYLWRNMIILTNGDVIPCCHPDFDMVMGNAYETPVLEIWNGKMYSHFRRLHSESKWDEIPPCVKCVTWMTTKAKVRREKDRIIEIYPFYEVYRKIPHVRSEIARAVRHPRKAYRYLLRKLRRGE